MARNFKGPKKTIITQLIEILAIGYAMLKHFSVILFVLSLLIVPEARAADTVISGEQELLLFYSNDVVGETDPCG